MTVTRIDAGTEWRDERLYVLHMIEDLKAESRRQSEAAAIERVSVLDKAQRDISQAHDKIRALENSETLLKLKNWILAGAVGAAGAGAFELVKGLLHGWKP